MRNSASSAAHAQAFALSALPILLNNDDWLKIRRPASRIGGFCFFKSFYSVESLFWKKYVGLVSAGILIWNGWRTYRMKGSTLYEKEYPYAALGNCPIGFRRSFSGWQAYGE